jgi:5-keto-L-gluconate epimerase
MTTTRTSLATSPTPAKFSPLLFAGELKTAMHCAANLGYDGIELNLRDSADIDQEGLAAQLTQFGLSVPSIGTGQSYLGDGLSLADPDPDVQKKVRQRMHDHIRFAALLGASVVIGSVRGRLDDRSVASRKACYATALEATRSLAEFASVHGVGLTVEPINRYETNFLNTIAEALEFIDQVGSANLGLLADTFHMNIEEASMDEPLGQAGPRLRHVHLVDSNRRAPGLGHLEFGPILAALGTIGFSGYLSAEILPIPDDETAATIWMETYRTLETAGLQAVQRRT